MTSQETFNLADHEACGRLPDATRRALTDWVLPATRTPDLAPYLTMLYLGFVFQRFARDVLEERVAGLPGCPAGLEGANGLEGLEALRILYLSLKREAAEPCPHQHAIRSCRLAADTVVRELERLRETAPPRERLGLDDPDFFLPGLAAELDRCGSVVLFRGPIPEAAHAALALAAAGLGRRRVPMTLLGGGSSFDRAFAGQNYLNVEYLADAEWRDAGRDAESLKRLLAGRRLAGALVAPDCRALGLARDLDVHAALREVELVLLGAVPPEHPGESDPERGLFIHEARILTPLSERAGDPVRPRFLIDGRDIPVPPDLLEAGP